jgi:hypothetical protein
MVVIADAINKNIINFIFRFFHALIKYRLNALSIYAVNGASLNLFPELVLYSKSIFTQKFYHSRIAMVEEEAATGI